MLTSVSSRRNPASILSWLANAAVPWRKSIGRNNKFMRPVFAGVWKQSEEAWSVVLAQAPALSAPYRRLFLLEASQLVTPSIGTELRGMAERDAAVGSTQYGGVLGTISAFGQFDGGLVVGIENEKPTGLDRKARLRYDEYLQLRNSDPILMLLMPGENAFLNEEAAKLDRFVPVNCEQLAGWADGCLVDWLSYTAPKIEIVLQDLTRLLSAAIMNSERDLPEAMQCSLG